MIKIVFTFFVMLLGTAAIAQQVTRDELEKQKVQLKKELEQTERMLNDNKAKSKENFVQWKLINDKVNIQDRIIDNINRDINLLDNNLINTQRDINRYDKLLDTLKQEYTKSMVYAYKNRSNYDFLNFIFSASSFNDAIKRITYLKSYRNYREMQGENILHTQELRKKRIEELTGTKQKKNVVLQDKDKEMSALETQQKEKDRILSELKKEGKQLNNQYAAKRKQMQRVENSITANIRRAIEDAKKLAIKKAAEDKAKQLVIDKATTKINSNPSTTTTTASTTKPVKAPIKKVTTPVVEQDFTILNSGNITTNTNFINSKGSMVWPVDKGYVLMHFGPNILPSGSTILQSNITIATEIGSPVKSSFEGVVTTVTEDEGATVMIQHGRYFTTYSNLTGVTVKRGQSVTTGQVIGKALANLEGVGAIEFYIYDEKSKYYDPEKWLRRR